MEHSRIQSEWIDIHCHLNHLEGGADLALEQAKEAGVSKIITIGTEPEDLPLVLELAQAHHPNVYCTLGIHPHEGAKYSNEVREFIIQNASRPEVLAIGEIGLDYYYNHSDKKSQIDAFESQMDIALSLNLPVEIHTRDAEHDTVEILKKYKGKVNGVIHCFTGTDWLAKEVLDLGYNISISGVVTFKSAESLRSIVKNIIPLDRLHVETDAPFLSPVPLRGRPNTSAYMIHTAKVVADLKGVTMDELSLQTKKNALELFKKLKWN